MLFNHALKITFAIPLNSSLNLEGFAFPSGHMQFSVALYGYLSTQCQNRYIKISIVGLLICIGLSLIYCGYHNIIDILGGAFFALLLIKFNSIILNHYSKNYRLLLFIFASFLMVYIALKDHLAAHLYLSYYSLIGLLISEKYGLKIMI